MAEGNLILGGSDGSLVSQKREDSGKQVQGNSVKQEMIAFHVRDLRLVVLAPQNLSVPNLKLHG